MDIRTEVRKMKEDSPAMAASSLELRNQALAAAAKALSEHKEEIFAANRADMEAAEKAGIAPAVMKRLNFDEHKLADVIAGIGELIRLPDPLSRIQLAQRTGRGTDPLPGDLPDRRHRHHLRGKTGCPGADLLPVYQKRKLCRVKGRKRNCPDE